jgi:hypothetical protein
VWKNKQKEMAILALALVGMLCMYDTICKHFFLVSLVELLVSSSMIEHCWNTLF